MSRGQVFLGYFVWGDKIRGGQKILLHLCKEVGPAPDSPGQKVEQANHLQQTEEESEEEKSSQADKVPRLGQVLVEVLVVCSALIFIKWVWQNE